MPLDPRIPGSVEQPRFNDPFSQLATIRAQQQQSQLAQQQIASNQALEQDRRQQTAGRQQRAAGIDVLNKIGSESGAPDPMTGVWKFNAEKFQEGMAHSGHLDQLADIMPHVDAMNAAAEKRAGESRVMAANGLMAMRKAGWSAQSALGAATYLSQNGALSKDNAAQMIDAISADPTPANVEAIAMQFAQRIPEYQTMVDADEKQKGAAAKQIADVAKTTAETAKLNAELPLIGQPKPPTDLEGDIRAASKAGNAQEVRRLLNLKGAMNAAGRAPDKPADEGLVQIAGPDGGAIWVRKSDAIGKSAAQAARGITGIERQSLAFFNRAHEAEKVVTPLEDKIAGMSLAGQARLQMAPNILQSDENQSYRQAQRAFTEARLRKESGAAINDAEYEKDAKTYFAQPGDSKATIAQKQQARSTLLDGMAYSAGKAYDEFYGEPRPGSKAAKAPSSDAAAKAAALLQKYGG